MRKKLNSLHAPVQAETEFQPSTAAFIADVRRGLGKRRQKTLPPVYFYDSLGTALFDAITLLPEYGLTRADSRLLSRYAGTLIDRLGPTSVVAELGSGTGTKTRWILEAFGRQKRLFYCPIDVSASALEKCRTELDGVSAAEIIPFEGSYLDGLRAAAKLRRPDTAMLVLFLGSSIGNFDPDAAEALCRAVREILIPGDVFYLSTDLVKPAERVLPAYDDPLGVTAAFNLNVLARINRELGGSFDLSRFSHAVRYDRKNQRLEMHLRSTVNQMVAIGDDLRITFQESETIWTESSYKFQPEDVRKLAEASGFDCEIQWFDSEWPFAQSLLRAR